MALNMREVGFLAKLMAGLGSLVLLHGCTVPPTAAPAPPPTSASIDKPLTFPGLDESEQLWRQWRHKAQGRYHYTVRFQSKVGFSQVTTVRVEDNRVAERSFTFTPREPLTSQPDGSTPAQNTWTEQGAHIGTRAGAAPALTLDELYGQCRLLWSEYRPAPAGTRPEWTLPTLGLDHRGLLKSCTSTNTRTIGDAQTRGVNEIELFIQ